MLFCYFDYFYPILPFFWIYFPFFSFLVFLLSSSNTCNLNELNMGHRSALYIVFTYIFFVCLQFIVLTLNLFLFIKLGFGLKSFVCSFVRSPLSYVGIRFGFVLQMWYLIYTYLVTYHLYTIYRYMPALRWCVCLLYFRGIFPRS